MATQTECANVRRQDVSCQWSGSEENFRTLLTNLDFKDIANIAIDGEWEPLDNPRTGDIVQVTSSFLSCDDYMKVELRSMLRGRVRQIDEDGDLQVFFPDLLPYGLPAWFALRFVDRSQFGKMTRRKADKNSE